MKDKGRLMIIKGKISLLVIL